MQGMAAKLPWRFEPSEGERSEYGRHEISVLVVANPQAFNNLTFLCAYHNLDIHV